MLFVCAIVEQLSVGGSNGGPEDGERKVFFELGRADLAPSFHVEGGSATAATSGGQLPLSLEPLLPPPYLARDALGSYSVTSPAAMSFIQPNAMPACNVQDISAYCIQQQQQQPQHLSTSPFNVSAYGLYGCGGTHLGADAPLSLLSASSTYSDTMQPSVRNVSNGYLYPSGTDSRFSSRFLYLVFIKFLLSTASHRTMILSFVVSSSNIYRFSQFFY